MDGLRLNFVKSGDKNSAFIKSKAQINHIYSSYIYSTLWLNKIICIVQWCSANGTHKEYDQTKCNPVIETGHVYTLLSFHKTN